MKAKKKIVRFCPKYGSKDIFWAHGLPQLWSLWQCRECNYRGAFIIEDSKLAKKIREDYLRKAKKIKK